jgi:hypothetical protein
VGKGLMKSVESHKKPTETPLCSAQPDVVLSCVSFGCLPLPLLISALAGDESQAVVGSSATSRRQWRGWDGSEQEREFLCICLCLSSLT